MDNEKQHQAQKEFHDYPLKSDLDQAKKGNTPFSLLMPLTL